MDTKIYPLEFLYDGDCPICRSDVTRLHNADRHGRLIFIDITAPDFAPETYGRTREALLARIHARRADGVIVDGPEVFRLAMAAVGFEWLARLTRWPVFRQATEITYDGFARHRTVLARRFGGLFSRLTPECDLACQPFTERGKANTPHPPKTETGKPSQAPENAITMDDSAKERR